jgi:hypothetical protein
MRVGFFVADASVLLSITITVIITIMITITVMIFAILMFHHHLIPIHGLFHSLMILVFIIALIFTLTLFITPLAMVPLVVMAEPAHERMVYRAQENGQPFLLRIIQGGVERLRRVRYFLQCLSTGNDSVAALFQSIDEVEPLSLIAMRAPLRCHELVEIAYRILNRRP